MSTSFKLFFSETDIRRICLESNTPSYQEFTILLQSLYPENYHPELFIKWRDEEGDQITVSSQLEWEQMLLSLNERPIKLYITEGLGPYFKDGPPAQPQLFYTEDNEKAEEIKKEPELLERLKNSVPQCLQHLFKGDRILPYDLPEWVKDAVKIKKLSLPGNQVDLDIDIPKLLEVMQQRALKLMSDAKNIQLIKEAKALLLDVLAIVPKHAITLYNLSCAESLLGNIKEAVQALRSAIFEGGYSNVEHMEKDEDLSNIRGHPEYQELVNSLKKKEDPMESDEKMQENLEQENPIETKPTKPLPEPMKVEEAEIPISLGEKKWADAIQLLKGMGFGNDTAYFGPRCVVLLENHHGDLSLVINDLLQN